MKLLTNEQQKSNENAKVCYIYNGNFEDEYDNIVKLEIIVISQVNIEMLHIEYVN